MTRESTRQDQSPLQAQPIHKLDNRLANQIAAGEVVERPASVVKELLENAIDSAANRIEVDIERGGTRLIRVTDNGCGIEKEDLVLALSRHATSKITHIDDLAAISSLGFRGEALASIGSVSRLCLTSRTHQSQHAWQATAQGRDMAVQLEPAAARVGTRIEVADLFYNTPARLKFLRAEKTEFAHIEEIFKRHALANPTIAMLLRHKGKVVKRIPASDGSERQFNRIGRICGKAFADNCIAFDCQLEDVQINGWLGLPHFHRSESDLQYVFVNGRPVKDKMLNHAIKQAYQGMLPTGRMATFVIFLSLDPQQIDVNVHPTKHEVRFDQSRMVHDLLVKSVIEALTQAVGQRALAPLVGFPNAVELTAETEGELAVKPDSISSLHHRNASWQAKTSYPSHSIDSVKAKAKADFPQVSYQSVKYDVSHSIASQAAPEQPLSTHSQESIHSPLKAIQQFSNGFLMLAAYQKLYMIDQQALLKSYLKKLINQQLPSHKKPLLFPQKLNIEANQLEEVGYFERYQRLGFELTPQASDANQKNYLLLKQIPQWLASYPTESLLTQLEICLKQTKQVSDLNADSLYQFFFSDALLIEQSLTLFCLTQLNFPNDDKCFSREITHHIAKSLFDEN